MPRHMTQPLNEDRGLLEPFISTTVPNLPLPAVMPSSLKSIQFREPARLKLYAAGPVRSDDWRGLFFREPELLFQGSIEALPPQWPVLPKAFVETFDYCGPYLIRGLSGPSSHGVAASGFLYQPGNLFPVHLQPEREDERLVAGGYIKPDSPESVTLPEGPFWSDEPMADEARRKHVRLLCFQAISLSDIVFAWIDSPTCYGTLVEIGYAKALRKRIWIAGPAEFSDLWFAYSCADLLTFEEEKPVPGFTRLLKHYAQRVA